MSGPQKVYERWEDSGHSQIAEFVCECGYTIVESSSEDAVIESHGCGHREREIIECPECYRIYEGNWVGMEYIELDE